MWCGTILPSSTDFWTCQGRWQWMSTMIHHQSSGLKLCFWGCHITEVTTSSEARRGHLNKLSPIWGRVSLQTLFFCFQLTSFPAKPYKTGWKQSNGQPLAKDQKTLTLYMKPALLNPACPFIPSTPHVDNLPDTSHCLLGSTVFVR